MIFSVSEANNFIKALLDAVPQLQTIFVRGEISNYKLYPSGHHYFTLKDEGSALKCVMFRGMAGKLRFRPENGMKVIAFGRIGVFPRDGAYQLYCSELSAEGVGDLHVAFEQLKEKLFKEGLFAPEHKKPLPKYPKRIAIITSSAGAAVHDMLRILNARWPMSEVVLLPVRVQGAEAPPEIAGALRYANKWQVADLIITGRGGGSIEDLWAFNEEELVRVVAACTKPIISAVGHETDTTLTDYAADMRAPTPSAAAELAVYSYRDLTMELRESARQLQQSIYHLIKLKKILLTRYEMALSHSSPQDQIRQRRLYLADSEERLKRLLEQKLTSAKHQMALYAEELKGLSPLYKLQGGYAYVADDAGNNIKSIDQLKKGQRLTLTLKDGQADVVVQDVASKR